MSIPTQPPALPNACTPSSSSSASHQGRYVLVFGSGHCGTRWIAHALHRPEHGMAFHHEQKYKMVHEQHQIVNPWGYCYRYEMEHGLGPLYDDYWRFIKVELKEYRVVGDSVSWLPVRIPEIEANHLPIDRGIFLVRNGIQTVHSIFKHSKTIPIDNNMFMKLASDYRQLFPQNNAKYSYEYVKWVHDCALWHDTSIIYERDLRQSLGPERLICLRLEDVTSNGDVFLKLLLELDPESDITSEEIGDIQKTDVNRKVQGSREPELIWREWSEPQKGIFNHICGEAMTYFGYTMP
ncbi:MAG: hypothetical protein ABIH23_08185 [bacterium]